jgi:hypothetical protein
MVTGKAHYLLCTVGHMIIVSQVLKMITFHKPYLLKRVSTMEGNIK